MNMNKNNKSTKTPLAKAPCSIFIHAMLTPGESEARECDKARLSRSAPLICFPRRLPVASLPTLTPPPPHPQASTPSSHV